MSPPCLRPFLIRCVRRSPLALLVVRPGYGEEGVRIAPSPARPESREAGILAELLLLLWDGVCGVWRALRLGLLLLPCLLGACLTLLPAPLPSLSLSSLASLLTWTAEAAGPVYVKLGQWAATRRDLLPGEVCRGLARLQTRTRPHSWAATERVLRQEFGEEWGEVYGRLWMEERIPVASGCCAQVYHGWVDDQEVAVKVVHPDLPRLLQLDIMVISAAVRFINWLLPSTQWLNLQTAVEEFNTLLTGQLDLREEAKNLNKFRENFKNSKDIIFPEPLAGFCKRRVIVETWISGESISASLKPEVDEGEKRRLAGLGSDLLLSMVFRDNFWHGDLHPGNLLVTPEGQLAVLDTGIACSLSQGDRDNLVDTFKAIVLGDGARVGELFLERSDHECRDRQGFMDHIQDIVRRAREQQLSLDRVDVSLLLQEVFSTLMHHQVKLDASFTSLVIAVAIVEGLGRSLDNKLDLVARALPHLTRAQLDQGRKAV